MQVLVLGGESTGGHLTARLLSADSKLKVVHYSMPHGGLDERHWPTDRELRGATPDAVVVTIRAWGPMMASKVVRHEPDPARAEEEVMEAYERIFAWLQRRARRWRWLVYEALVADPETVMESLWRWLGRPPLPLSEPVEDADAKWAS